MRHVHVHINLGRVRDDVKHDPSNGQFSAGGGSGSSGAKKSVSQLRGHASTLKTDIKYLKTEIKHGSPKSEEHKATLKKKTEEYKALETEAKSRGIELNPKGPSDPDAMRK